MRTQNEKALIFRQLHEDASGFIIPNPYDIGTAKILESVGFKALATTGAGYAFTLGQRDGSIGRERLIQYVSQMASATDLPVSADLEDCFGDNPNVVSETFRMCAAAGCVGGSLEDLSSRGNAEPAIYDLSLAVERVQAAVETARAFDFPFMVTARCENYLAGNPDLKDTIKRLQAYQEAGADVLYAPGLSTREDIVAVVESVDRPVNVVMGLRGVQLSLAELSEIGVKRVSVGSALSRAALGAFLRAAKEMHDKGEFTFAKQAASYGEINSLFS